MSSDTLSDGPSPSTPAAKHSGWSHDMKQAQPNQIVWDLALLSFVTNTRMLDASSVCIQLLHDHEVSPYISSTGWHVLLLLHSVVLQVAFVRRFRRQKDRKGLYKEAWNFEIWRAESGLNLWRAWDLVWDSWTTNTLCCMSHQLWLAQFDTSSRIFYVTALQTCNLLQRTGLLHTVGMRDKFKELRTFPGCSVDKQGPPGSSISLLCGQREATHPHKFSGGTVHSLCYLFVTCLSKRKSSWDLKFLKNLQLRGLPQRLSSEKCRPSDWSSWSSSPVSKAGLAWFKVNLTVWKCLKYLVMRSLL